MYSGTYNSQEIVSSIGDFGMTVYEEEPQIHSWISDWKFMTKGF
jgi:hypothetical protein